MATKEIEQLYAELTEILPFYVGRNDRTGKVYRYASLKEAEAKIVELEAIFPVDVHNGAFYIDGPEDLINSR
jgi:hypothetical protein